MTWKKSLRKAQHHEPEGEKCFSVGIPEGPVLWIGYQLCMTKQWCEVQIA